MQFSEWEIYFKWKVYQDFRPFFTNEQAITVSQNA